jgi:hypothetical protein
LEEKFGTFRNAWPTYSYTHDLENDNFIHTRAIFCVDRLYNVQIVGLKTAQDELLKCLEGVWVKDKPMAVETFAKGTQPGMKEQVEAQRIGYLVGRYTVFAMIGIGVLFLLVKIGREVVGGGRKRPPPLPAHARVGATGTMPPPVPPKPGTSEVPPPPPPPAGL